MRACQFEYKILTSFLKLVFVESDYSYYNLILKKAGQFLDDIHINLLKFAFSIRAYSPAVHMFQQVCKNTQPALTKRYVVNTK